MKFHTLGQKHGQSIKDQIVKRFREIGFISLGEVKEIAGDFALKDDKYIGWDDDSDLDRKIRVREIKKGWYVYLPEPNAIIKIGEEIVGEELNWIEAYKDTQKKIDEYNKLATKGLEEELEVFKDICRSIEQLALNVTAVSFTIAQSYPAGLVYRQCIIKAKKSGRKEERQDRPAKFHRWADLSKGVQQVVAIVEFEDGHVEQVQPDRVIFKEEK